ncbi:asparagine synthase (glutamine-hydrolyzing) [Candidatus Marinamargulisbacteria bacterium SCGC AG-414-C22]|nr:asparagine synthase (glutamine-hydrolyzing) [Candidatus Marinamargulisbacteria bacterium SCGC AG-414-C22]
MCGIFGQKITNDWELKQSLLALNALAHRGPNDTHYWYDNKIFSGHRRLSIIDLSSKGKQPFTDNEVITTTNGEIYNYKELKNELEHDFKFYSNSDSEVILHGYKKWGLKKLVKKIDGMYAGSIYDIKKQKVFLFRDRCGIKPLYYSCPSINFSWASELKSLELLLKKTKLEIDKTALYDFFTYLYIPSPKTLFKKIYKLPPAHFLEYDIKTNRITIEKYWKIKKINSYNNLDEKEITSKLKQLISDSIKKHSISDVPIGSFLSGGLDSSIVTLNLSKINKSLKTFTIKFENHPNDESQDAKTISDLLGTSHFEKTITSNKTETLLKKFTKWYDEPFGDTSAFPSYEVSKLAKEHVKVVLTGDGGDEVFGGYKWYNRMELLNKYKYLKYILKLLIPKKCIPFITNKYLKGLSLFCLNEFEQYTKLMGGLIPIEKRKLKKKLNIEKAYDDFWYFKKFHKKELPIKTRFQYIDFNTYLHDDILTKVDRVSMSNSIETRVPLLNTELIEFIFSLKENHRYYNNELKGILKETYKTELPNSILNKKKQGFSIPEWKNIKSKLSPKEIINLFLNEKEIKCQL